MNLQSAREKTKEILSKLSGRCKIDTRLIPVIILALCAVAALVASTFTDEKKEGELHEKASDNYGAPTEYAAEIESRLCKLLSEIEGAGVVKVMVTLESGEEQVFARDSDSSFDNEADGDKSIKEKSDYVIVDGQAVRVKTVEPEIRGVAVVCEGGNDFTVKQSIVQAVTAVLGISAARVSVAQMKR